MTYQSIHLALLAALTAWRKSVTTLIDKILAKSSELAKAKAEGDSTFMAAYSLVYEEVYNEQAPKTANGLMDWARYWPGYWSGYWSSYWQVYHQVVVPA